MMSNFYSVDTKTQCSPSWQASYGSPCHNTAVVPDLVLLDVHPLEAVLGVDGAAELADVGEQLHDTVDGGDNTDDNDDDELVTECKYSHSQSMCAADCCLAAWVRSYHGSLGTGSEKPVLESHNMIETDHHIITVSLLIIKQ